MMALVVWGIGLLCLFVTLVICVALFEEWKKPE